MRILKYYTLPALLIFSFILECIGNDRIERKQLFDSNWKFLLGDVSTAYTTGFDDNAWRNLNLPHDWSIEGVLSANNPTGNDGGYFPAGIGWYRKKFLVPDSWKDKSVSIYFEGVYMNSEVFINGKSLGFHPYGYTSFRYDLTPYLKLNEENVISVRVDNSKQKNCRWYSGSGIYRHVWMIVTEPVYVSHWGVNISATDVSAEKATVYVRTKIKNETGLPQNITLKTMLSGNNSGNTGEKHLNVELPANSEKEIEQTIQVLKPSLWSPETPYLYKAQVQIVKGKTIIDNTTTTFGLRSIKYTPENGFQLNGKTVKLNGGCVHHDNGCLGAAAFDRAEERRVELLKNAGFNAVRTSHNPPSEAFLDACDRLGMLVIDESFDGWKEKKTQFDYAMYFNEWWQKDVESMVLRDRNHPSIIMWSIGNEVIERKSPEVLETARKLADLIHKYDPTRPVTSAMTTWDSDWEIFDPLFAIHDIGGYNYQLHRAIKDHERVPSRIIVQTESYPRDAFINWKLVNYNNYIIGDFVWTAIDYLGESGIGRFFYPGEKPGEHWQGDFFPWHGAYCGDIDLIGWRKPISHYRNMLYNNTEKLYMAVREPDPDSGKIKTTSWSVWPTWESWTWPGYEGKELQVEVYSKYPRVKLYLNNILIGEKNTTEEEKFMAVFNIPYSEGTLSATGIIDNKEAETINLKTSGEAESIKLTADRTKILANGQDLTFVTVEITDKDGILQPDAESELNFYVDGPGVIAGVDNANLKDISMYIGNTRKTWHGKALVVIRSTKTEGDIKLTVRSSKLNESTIIIHSGK